jgi:hypothetical protein
MFHKAFLALSAVGLITATALTAQPASRPASKGDPDRQICRTFKDTGSRLGGYRACHTAAEWAELRRQSVQAVDRLQNSRAGDAQ